MKAVFVTYADLGTKTNLKTDEILPALRFFMARGAIGQIISRVGTDRSFAPVQKSAIPWIVHAGIAAYGKIAGAMRARRIEERVFDVLASRMLREKGIVFFHPDMCPRTIAKAKRMGSVCVAIPSVADQRFVRKMLADEMAKWGEQIPGAIIDKSSVGEMDYLVTNSAYGTGTYVAEGFPGDRIMKAEYDIDLDHFKPNPLPRDGFTVLFPASNTTILKGLQYLLDAWTRLDIPDKKLIILGSRSGWPKTAEEQAAHIISNDHTIIERGYVSDIAPLVSGADVVVQPTFTEGFGKSIAESLASGVPVVATDRVTDLVRNGENGIIVPVADADAIKDAMLYLHDNPSVRKSMGEKGRQIMLEKKGFGERLYEIYEIINQTTKEKPVRHS